jgi:hypothetical protein
MTVTLRLNIMNRYNVGARGPSQKKVFTLFCRLGETYFPICELKQKLYFVTLVGAAVAERPRW